MDRLLPDGTTDPDEIVNQSQIWITSAGYKNSYPYSKLIEMLVCSIVEPENYMVLGANYELSILEGALKEEQVRALKLDDTFNELSFEREYKLFCFCALKIIENCWKTLRAF